MNDMTLKCKLMSKMSVENRKFQEHMKLCGKNKSNHEQPHKIVKTITIIGIT